jgi:hypothetical protein
MSEAPRTSQSHPAPHRDRTSLAALFFAITAGPAAWTIQHLVGYGVSSYPCSPANRQLSAPAPFWTPMRPGLIALTAVCLVLCLIGGWVALRSWRATQGETAGEAPDLLEIGAGRSRWMAICGIMVTVLFAGAILFDGIILVGAPTCRG